MKHIFLVLLFISAAVLVRAQSNGDKLYGFRQQVTPGAKRAGDIDETGKLLKSETPDAVRYLIYFTTSSKNKIYPVQLWINGEAFSVKAERQTAAQLLQEDAERNPEKIKTIVVDKPRSLIWKITPVPLIADKSGGKAKALVSTNALVLLYKSSGKMRHGVLKKFTEVDGPARQ